MEGEFFVLKIIFSNIHMETVWRNIVERFACDLHLFGRLLSADKSTFDQFFLDLDQVILASCNIQGFADGLQIINLIFRFFDQFWKSLESTFLFIIPVKIFLCIFLRCFLRIQRNFDHFVSIIIECFQFFCTFFQIVTVGVDQFSVYLVFIAAFRIAKLL